MTAVDKEEKGAGGGREGRGGRKERNYGVK